jgi:hypothetical protein
MKTMNSQQYEELCRHFLAVKIGISVDQIKSVHIPNPARPGLPVYQHQIDLYWETETDLIKYLHIANSKWRGNDKVDQPEILLLQQVKQDVAAHKALILTTCGYTEGAIAAAKDKGIALHIVKPDFDISILPTRDRDIIQAKLREVAAASNQPIFLHVIVHKAFDFAQVSPQGQPFRGPSGFPGHQTKVVTSYETKAGGGYTTKGGGPSGTVTKAGGPVKTK